jgi:hypothetical protein
MIFKKLNVFNIFDQFVTDYKNKKILDFGGNRGNLISYSNGKIHEKNYTCMDVSKDSLNALLNEHPAANVVYWNRYHSIYNPAGSKTETFPNIGIFDISFANSVFTHHNLEELLYCVANLCTISTYVYFTYIDPSNQKIFDILHNTHRTIDVSEKQMKKIRSNKVSYITNNDNMLWSVFDTVELKKSIKKYSRFQLSIEDGLTDGFNWMKITVLDRNIIVPSLIGY